MSIKRKCVISLLTCFAIAAVIIGVKAYKNYQYTHRYISYFLQGNIVGYEETDEGLIVILHNQTASADVAGYVGCLLTENTVYGIPSTYIVGKRITDVFVKINTVDAWWPDIKNSDSYLYTADNITLWPPEWDRLIDEGKVDTEEWDRLVKEGKISPEDVANSD